MPTGQLRELRHTQCQDKNNDLLREFLKDIRVGGLSEKTALSYDVAIKDFLDFICGLDVTQASSPRGSGVASLAAPSWC
jgi:hypothetical protein